MFIQLRKGPLYKSKNKLESKSPCRKVRWQGNGVPRMVDILFLHVEPGKAGIFVISKFGIEGEI